MFNFERLEVYNFALIFSKEVLTESINWSSKYQYSLADQIRRASLSISLNIAEGSSRSSKDFKRFLTISRGSAFECIPLIEIAYDQKLISTNTKEIWYNHCVSLAKMLSKLKSSI